MSAGAWGRNPRKTASAVVLVPKRLTVYLAAFSFAVLPHQPTTDMRSMDLLNSAWEEVRIARQHMGWGLEGLAMRLSMLILPKKIEKTTGVPQEAMVVDPAEAPVDRITEWERLLCWAHASYGKSERSIARRCGEIKLQSFVDGAKDALLGCPCWVEGAQMRGVQQVHVED